MKLRITLEGRTYEVDVEVVDGAGATGAPEAQARPAPRQESAGETAQQGSAPAPASDTAAGENLLNSPIAGSVLQVNVKPGDTVTLNQVLLVMEAMKMETNIASPVAGKIKSVQVKQGDTVRQGQALVEFE